MRRLIPRLSVVVCLLLAACGGDGDGASEGAGATTTAVEAPGTTAPPETTARETTTTTESSAPLEEALLTLDDMPTGWTTAPELLDDGEEEQGECTFDADLGEEDESEVAFKQGDSGPFVLQAAGQFDEPAAAERFMVDFAAFVERCRSFEEEGVATTITDLSFPELADESFAFRMAVDDPEGVLVEINAILFRSSARASVVAVFSVFESPDAALTEELATLAAERL